MANKRMASHNQQQVSYFENTVKTTMLPDAESPYVRRHLDAVASAVNLRPQDKVVEVGCGMGRYTLPLLARGFRISGVDISGGLLDNLAKFNNTGRELILHRADIVDAASTIDQRFDVLLGFFTLHHVHDLRAVFEGACRLLKPGGRVAFLEPNPYNPLYYLQIFGSRNMKWSAEKGLVRLRRRALFSIMSDVGLGDIRLQRLGFFPPFIANSRAGSLIESGIERIPGLGPLLPFQVFSAVNREP